VAFSFIDEKNIKDFVTESDDYMRPFYKDLAEYERIGHGKPGRVPKGKPTLTDGVGAAIKRETPKRIIQQVPTGKVSIKKCPELEPYVNGVLTDEILLNANSGGTPYSKSKKGIKDTITSGASFAYCFYNRRGDWFGADFKRVAVRDIGFEKGKTTEFDSNVMKMSGWYTKMDLKALIHYGKNLEKSAKSRGETSEFGWYLKFLAQLLDENPDGKPDENKTAAEKAQNDGIPGFYRIDHVFQIGKGATFYAYSPRLDKVVKKTVSKDPRGIIPIHGMVPEEDDASPLGEALIAISAGKINLLDFDMQMYQYNRGALLEPPVKKWGNVPTSAIKLVPGAVIDMGGNKQSGNDIETVDINNSAITDYRNNSSYIKTQIYNEQGASSDSSISASVGAVGFSKTDRGVAQQEAKLGISDNDLRKCYESWFGRVCETMLNLHFAESKGKRELELKKETVKRLRLDPEKLTMDYDKDYGPIAFTVDASTSEASDSKQENEQLVGLLEITQKYGGLRPDRQMAIVNQVIKNSGVDDAENLTYTDEEIEQAKQLALNPPPPAPAEPPMPAMPPMPVEGEVMPPQEQMPVPEEQPQQGLTDEEMATIQQLQERGTDPETIATIITMLRSDYPDEAIAAVLQGGAA
jgi:hypothetical protein